MRRIAAVVVSALVTATLFASSPVPATGDSYVVRDADTTYILGRGMSAGELKVLQTQFGDHFLWVRRAGARYVIRDAASLQKALEFLQRNVPAGPERDARFGIFVDGEIKVGRAERLP